MLVFRGVFNCLFFRVPGNKLLKLRFHGLCAGSFWAKRQPNVPVVQTNQAVGACVLTGNVYPGSPRLFKSSPMELLIINPY